MITATTNVTARLSRINVSNNITLTAPGSKSETNRALLLASMCDSQTEIHNCLICDDTQVMINALRNVGVSISNINVDPVIVKGKVQFNQPSKPLFVGNSGTTSRFLTAACCLANQSITIDGNEDLRNRPIQPLVVALRDIGFSIYAENDFSVPVHIQPHKRKAFSQHIVVDGKLSSQFTSALMMIAPRLPGGLTIELSNPNLKDSSGYYDVTINCLQAFGVNVTSPRFGLWKIDEAALDCGQRYQIEADYSASTYLWAAKALSNKNISISNCAKTDTAQPDINALPIIQAFPHMPSTIDGSNMQDAVPTLAVLAALNHNRVRFTRIQNLRVKECDRIIALNQGLNRVKSGLAEIVGDDLIVHGDPELKPDQMNTRIATFNDHRIAMSFALLAFRLNGIVIENPHCVNKTFPNYWQTLKKIGIAATISSSEQD